VEEDGFATVEAWGRSRGSEAAACYCACLRKAAMLARTPHDEEIVVATALAEAVTAAIA